MSDNKRPDGYRSKPGEFDGDESHREQYPPTPQQPLPAIDPYGNSGESEYSGTGVKLPEEGHGNPPGQQPKQDTGVDANEKNS